MKRRSFLRTGTVFLGAPAGASVAFSLAGTLPGLVHAAERKERWISPSSITPLQCYVAVAKEKGFFEAEGLDITIQATPGTANAVTQLAAGAAKFAQGAAITTVPAIANRDAGVITVGQTIYRSVFELTSPADNPIRPGDSLAGKTIGVMSMGGSTDQLLDAICVASGTDPKSVKRVVTGFSASAYAFLQRKQVDAFFTYYPMRLALEAQGAALIYVNTDDIVPIPPDSIIVARSALDNEADRAAVVGYLRACAKGLRFLLDPANWDEATTVLGKYNPVEAQDRALARKKFEAVAALAKRPAHVPFLHCDDQAWTSGVRIMEQCGFIKPNAKPMSAYYTNDLVKLI
jgi:NitT/TauT family transport system substrate-binding protein